MLQAITGWIEGVAALHRGDAMSGKRRQAAAVQRLTHYRTRLTGHSTKAGRAHAIVLIRVHLR